ncbi:MAG: thioesterase [Alphaproteobacteria bacterium]|nr:thioesterase [Alphaproteobacteria bacterium]
MNLYIRLVLVLIKSLWRKRLALLETSITHFHVLPNDLDLNMHMNNGRYLTVMDLGRIDLMMRCGLLQKALKHKYAPVLGSVKMRYRLPLLPFQPYELQTRIVCWDEKWAYMEQRFIITSGTKKGAIAAIAIIKAGMYDPKAKETVKPDALMSLLELGQVASPDMPDYFKDWVKAESALQAVTAQ